MKNPTIRYDIIVEVDGEKILNSLTARLLLEVKNKGSLLKASQSMGVPYSKAWDMINRAERTLGEKLVETWKGGKGRGGAELTPIAEELIGAYLSGEKRLIDCIGPLYPRVTIREKPSLIVAYSHDHIIEVLLERIGNKLSVEGVCSGSLRALAMLSLGEADISCIHLYDPVKDEYNKPFLHRYYIENPVRLGGYKREVVIATNPELEVLGIDEIIDQLRFKKVKIVNRNPGSGTRLYLDHLLEEAGIDRSGIKGYDNIKFTHEEVAREIASGRADVGVTIRYYSELYGLKSFTLKWENYECYTTTERIGSEGTRFFLESLNSGFIRDMIEKLPGYRMLG
ncbi:MAG: LysR family transcriptional regulator [Desulfurococcales archaeon]|nr:LysR family transcriptional regulator [Desulfurococcales archaeon]